MNIQVCRDVGRWNVFEFIWNFFQRSRMFVLELLHRVRVDLYLFLILLKKLHYTTYFASGCEPVDLPLSIVIGGVSI